MPSNDTPVQPLSFTDIFVTEIKFMSNLKNDSTMRKRILLSVFSVLFTAGLFAQGQGLAGINEATSLMTSYFDPATKLCYAIGAVLGLVGGIKTYGKFSSGDPDTSKTAASWFFACIFLIVAATILRSFFL
ncbi:conjugative transposon protein TraE [Bacteroides fluxus YIT 12057]|uniref:Conjugative transposon protein TraE n=5 Tax=root TaxID=1 RepID=F3PYU3_9BACE|nr:conjugative transposon protein TraE [Bacteroides fluxus YIT 12057]